MTEMNENNFHAKKGKRENEREGDRDARMFLNDIEEDPEMRANINLYKVSSANLLTVLAG